MSLSDATADSHLTASRNECHQGDSQNAQADAIRNILNDILRYSNICSEVTQLTFIDELSIAFAKMLSNR